MAMQLLYGVRWEWLMTGKGEMWVSAPAPPAGALTRVPAEAVEVPLFEGQITFERDGETPKPGPTTVMHFMRAAVLKPLLARAGQGSLATLALVRVPDDPAMEPLLRSGGLVLVNTALQLRLRPLPGALVWLRFNGCGHFRRAFVDSAEPWTVGGLSTLTDDPMPKGRLWPFTPTEAGMADLVQGVAML